MIVNDDLIAKNLLASDVVAGDTDLDGVLDVGESWTYNVTYEITQGDLDNRGLTDGVDDNILTNTVVVTSDEGIGGNARETVELEYSPGLTVSKTLTVGDGTVDEAGDVINYNIRIENTGNITLTEVTVVDPLFGGELVVTAADPGVDQDGLDPGEVWQFNRSVTVSQADLDDRTLGLDGIQDGTLTNTVTVEAATNLGTVVGTEASTDV